MMAGAFIGDDHAVDHDRFDQIVFVVDSACTTSTDSAEPPSVSHVPNRLGDLPVLQRNFGQSDLHREYRGRIADMLDRFQPGMFGKRHNAGGREAPLPPAHA